MQPTLSDQEFSQFRHLIYDIAGISLSEAKKPLVSGRLAKRLKHHGVARYADYFRLICERDHAAELQTAVDLLTTNETYFFRESKHFDFLREHIVPEQDGRAPFRVWCGASSSGEEPYTIAMTLAEVLGAKPWEVLASDLSTRVLATARRGQYPMSRAESIPPEYLRKYCLKGVGRHEGTFLIERTLRERVRFEQINLVKPLPRLGEFDVIFLRNVMIYFDAPTKREVVARMLPLLKPGGHFIVSHSESLNGITEALRLVSPSIYRKP